MSSATGAGPPASPRRAASAVAADDSPMTRTSPLKRRLRSSRSAHHSGVVIDHEQDGL
jgi:hypothetical protein